MQQGPPVTGEFPPPPAPTVLHAAGAAAWAILGILLVAVLLGAILQKLWFVFPPLVIALATVYLIEPVLSFAQRRFKLPRLLALILVYLLAALVLALGGIAVVPIVWGEVSELIGRIPTYASRLAEIPVAIEAWLDRRGIDGLDLPGMVNDALRPETVTGQLQSALRLVQRTLSIALFFVVGPILAFYVLLDLPRIQRSAPLLIPEHRRDRYVAAVRDANRAIAAFVRGQLMLSVVVGMLSTLALRMLDVPNAPAIGVIAGFTNLVPTAGPIVGGIIAVLVTWAALDIGTAVWVALAFIVIQQVESQVLGPIIVGRFVQLRPATIMLVILIGAVLSGIWGMLLAIPLAAGAKAAAIRLWFPDLREQAENGRPPGNLRRLFRRSPAPAEPGKAAEQEPQGKSASFADQSRSDTAGDRVPTDRK